MFPSLILVLVGGILAVLVGCRNGDPVPRRPQLFIMYGESGMVGGERMTGSIPAAGSAMMLGFDGKWKAAYEPTHDSLGCIYTMYMGQTSGFSPGVAFAERIQQQVPALKVGLVPCARNGRNIQELSYGRPYFTACMERVATAREHGEVAGIIISQGINDAVQGVPAAVWKRDFEQLIRDLRAQVGQVPVVYMQLFPLPELQAYRDAQAEIALSGVVMITADDLPHLNTYHLNAEANKVLGQRYADAWLGMTEYKNSLPFSIKL